YAGHDHREERRNAPLHSEPDRSQCFQLVVGRVTRENALHEYVVSNSVQHRHVVVTSRSAERIQETSEKTRMGDGSEKLTDVESGGTRRSSIRMRAPMAMRAGSVLITEQSREDDLRELGQNGTQLAVPPIHHCVKSAQSQCHTLASVLDL